MIATFLLQALWVPVYFISIKPIAGYAGNRFTEPNSDVNMTFHKSPRVMYANHPVQGVCTGSPGFGGKLILILIGKSLKGKPRRIASYTLGSRPKKDEPIRITKLKLLWEKNDPLLGGKRISMAFKFCPLVNMDGGDLICKAESVRKSNYNTTISPLEFRYRPSKPHFKVRLYDMEPNVLIAGERVLLFCRASVPLSGYMGYRLVLPSGRVHSWNITWSPGFHARTVIEGGLYTDIYTRLKRCRLNVNG
ncbi:hypothetical protein ElyMa_002526400 [Elysia marginata]|uniref:Ig-like domain-containing protein n=1 Tax=Elysia marginata TaxID=1093978 RepID=A0AAV4GW46_9GAST|nr:hypothetical protein ElyMa_002526400 [Elysia marginata]